MPVRFRDLPVIAFVVISLATVAGTCRGANGAPLKVFVLVGQSNMQGHANVKTLADLATSPDTKPLLDELFDAEGNPRTFDDVWISYLSNGGEKHGKLSAGFGANDQKIGPELTFGLQMRKYCDEPILIIKAAWGGKSLNTDFRPPSAGPYEFQEEQLERLKKRGKDPATIKQEKAEATGRYYREMIRHVRSVLADIKRVYPDYDSEAGYELAGYVWFQGWNDMVDSGTYPDRYQPGGYRLYSKLMEQFIRDVRNDLKAPKLPFVIGVLGVGGPVEKYGKDKQRYREVHQNFRDAMAAPASLAEFKDYVVAVETEDLWDHELAELRTRERKVSQKLNELRKSGALSREDQAAKREELMDAEFSSAERQRLDQGISNFEFHYLGSGKIMARIGVAFADALKTLISS